MVVAADSILLGCDAFVVRYLVMIICRITVCSSSGSFFLDHLSVKLYTL